MPDGTPYLSVIVTSRNDDHGGSLLRRMQTFTNALIAQCTRHRIDAELIIVEWNPPADRPPLVEALKWPEDLTQCPVRLIQVSAELHAGYEYADKLPLFQMIAKNFGIRRARGQFLLITNIDILLNDDLAQFLAKRSLKPGVLYRIDRTDVDTDVPVDAPIREQLAYCLANHLRNNSAVGTIPLLTDGSVWGDTVVRNGLRFGSGWTPIEHTEHEAFVYASERPGELLVPADRLAATPFLWLDLQVGPTYDWATCHYSIRTDDGTVLLDQEISFRTVLCVRLPIGTTRVWFSTRGPARPIPADPRTLPYRLYGARLLPELCTRPLTFEGAIVDRPIVGESGIILREGWGSVVPDHDEYYVWGNLHTMAEVGSALGEFLVIDIQVGPSAGWRWFDLQIADDAGQIVDARRIVFRERIVLPAAAVAGRKIRFTAIGANERVPKNTPPIPFRIFGVWWTPDFDDRPRSGDDRIVVAAGVRLGTGWDLVEPDRTEHFVWARGPAGLRVGPAGGEFLWVDIQAGASADWRSVELRITNSVGHELAIVHVTARDRILLPANLVASQTVTLTPIGADKSLDNDVRKLPFRIFGVRWVDRYDPRPPAGDTTVVTAAGVRLLDGWDLLEPDVTGSFIYARGPADLAIERDTEGWLTFDLQPGPSAGWRPIAIRVETHSGTVLAAKTISGRDGLSVCVPAGTTRLRLLTDGATVPLPTDPRTLPFRVFGVRWADRFDPRPLSADEQVIRAAGVRLLDGWGRAESDPAGAFVWARGTAGLSIDTADGAFLILDLQAGPSAGWATVNLHVTTAGTEIGSFPITATQSICLPAAQVTGRTLTITPIGADIPTDGECPRLPFRLFGARWANQYDPRPLGDEALIRGTGIRLLDGWDRVEPEGAEHYAWARGPAEITFNTAGGSHLTLDLQAGPSAGWTKVPLRFLGDGDRELTSTILVARRSIAVAIPAGTQRVRIIPVGNFTPAPTDPRVLPFRCFGFRWTSRYEPRPATGDEKIVRAAGVRLLDGWGQPELALDGTPFVRSALPAALGIAKPAGAVSLGIVLELGPDTRGIPLTVRAVDSTGKEIGRQTIRGRDTLFLDTLTDPTEHVVRIEIIDDPSTDPAIDRIRLWGVEWLAGPMARLVSRGIRKVQKLVGTQPAILPPPPTPTTTSVASPTATPTTTPTTPTASPTPPDAAPVARPAKKSLAAVKPVVPSTDPDRDPLYYDPEPVSVPQCVADGKVPNKFPNPPALHLNACGDFHLLDRDSCFAVRGYAEFPIYSLHIDSLFSYTVHAAGIPEEVLPPPMFAYHIEHAKGTGATPEGIGELLSRMRKRGIPVFEWEQVGGWGTEMRNAGEPMHFNNETWGLPDVVLPEMRPKG